jgi:hypothetical protein
MLGHGLIERLAFDQRRRDEPLQQGFQHRAATFSAAL